MTALGKPASTLLWWYYRLEVASLFKELLYQPTCMGQTQGLAVYHWYSRALNLSCVPQKCEFP